MSNVTRLIISRKTGLRICRGQHKKFYPPINTDWWIFLFLYITERKRTSTDWAFCNSSALAERLYHWSGATYRKAWKAARYHSALETSRPNDEIAMSWIQIKWSKCAKRLQNRDHVTGLRAGCEGRNTKFFVCNVALFAGRHMALFSKSLVTSFLFVENWQCQR